MFVIKRDSERQSVRFDEILMRNDELVDLSFIGDDEEYRKLDVNVHLLTKDVISGMKDGMTTEEIDILSAEQAMAHSVYNPDYETLAARIMINNLQKKVPANFMMYLEGLAGDIQEDVFVFAKINKDKIEKAIDYSRDYKLTYIGYKVLEKSYLLKDKTFKIIERPQQMFMRVALGLHCPSFPKGCNIMSYIEKMKDDSIDKALVTYDKMSKFEFIHATPTLFNSGLRNNLSSCFLLSVEDSIEGIAKTNTDCMLISKSSGGIGIDYTPVRGCGAIINSTNRQSDGIIPFIKILNEIARGINQGGKRKGSISIYLQPWHPDIISFLELCLNTGIEERRARDIFPALWIPDIFFKRLYGEEDIEGSISDRWSLFCPHKYPDLIYFYGDDFEKRYLELERDERYESQISVFTVWDAIVTSLEEKGLPYMLSKDNVNKKSNQMNIGPITSSNLCTEIVEYNNHKSIASCNLASLGLSAYVKGRVLINNKCDYDQVTKLFDFKKLGRNVQILVQNLNNVIDRNHPPTHDIIKNNLDYRPIAIGVQGFADVLLELNLAFEDEVTAYLNSLIFETIYYNALLQSMELAKVHGPYKGFYGSPLSQGVFHFDYYEDEECSPMAYNWEDLRKQIKEHGVRNSLLVALMPTKSTSSILDNTESFEPITYNIYSKKLLAGDYMHVNKHLYRDLKELGLWTKENVNQIIRDNGSVQGVKEFPDFLKRKYKTVWEIKQKVLVELAASRQRFVDQSQSLNIYIKNPNSEVLSSLYYDGWKKGLKSLSYYLASQPATNPTKFSLLGEKRVDETSKKHSSEITSSKRIERGATILCDDEICLSCQ